MAVKLVEVIAHYRGCLYNTVGSILTITEFPKVKCEHLQHVGVRNIIYISHGYMTIFMTT